MEENLLKNNLLEIKDNDFEVSNKALNKLTDSMLYNIGNTDAELRDELIYTTFYKWIIEKEYYSHKELKNIFNTVLDDNHLFYKLGNSGDDSVFQRSFSALLIAILIARHNKDNYLEDDECEYLINRFFDYYQNEKDHRGYVLGKGWAHSAAHGADVLDELAQSDFVNRYDLLNILELIKGKIFINDYVYKNEEDERMVTATVTVIKNEKISNDDLKEWLKSFKDFEMPAEYYIYHKLITNIKSFLRSLYFRIIDNKEHYITKDILLEVIHKINKFRDN